MKNEFSTKDIYIASVLLYEQFQLVKVEINKKKPSKFIFSESHPIENYPHTLKDLVLYFSSGKLSVDPNIFVSCLKFLKSKLSETSKKNAK